MLLILVALLSALRRFESVPDLLHFLLGLFKHVWAEDTAVTGL